MCVFVAGDLSAERKPPDQAGDDGVGRQPGDDRAGGAGLPPRPRHLPGVQGQGRGPEEGRGLQGEQHPRHRGHVQVMCQILLRSCKRRKVSTEAEFAKNICLINLKIVCQH